MILYTMIYCSRFFLNRLYWEFQAKITRGEGWGVGVGGVHNPFSRMEPN